MPYTVYLKSSAEKELDRLPTKIHDRIVKRLISLRDNPRPPGTKKLLGREGYRIRVGDYRIDRIERTSILKSNIYKAPMLNGEIQDNEGDPEVMDRLVEYVIRQPIGDSRIVNYNRESGTVTIEYRASARGSNSKKSKRMTTETIDVL
jgi:mRNA interferase RelE/StbE